LQRFLRLQHDRELGEIEAADMDQPCRARLGRDANSMGKGVADLAQGDQPERRRQSSAGFDDVCGRAWRSMGSGLRHSEDCFGILIT